MSDRVLKESDVIREVKSLLVSDKMGYLNDLEYGNNQALCHVIDRIEDLPSAEWQEWIPCSERMPNDSDDVLITIKGNDFVSDGTYAGYYSNRWWYMCEDGEVTDVPILANVIAWMPLPKPYKEKDNE